MLATPSVCEGEGEVSLYRERERERERGGGVTFGQLDGWILQKKARKNIIWTGRQTTC